MIKKWPVIVAIILGIIAVGLINYYLRSQKLMYEQQLIKNLGKSEPVLVATQDIKKGTVVTDRMISEAGIPSRFIQPGAAYAKKAVVGKVTTAEIYKGEQMLSTKLAEKTSEEAKKVTTTSLAGLIPKGKRAITVEIKSADAAGGMLNPGDHVDIVATFKIPQEVEGKKQSQSITTTLFQDVKVLAVGEQLASAIEGLPSARKGPPPAPRSRLSKGILPVTFAMFPVDTQVLLAATQIGQIKLILRGKDEAVTAPLPPITPQQVLMRYLGLAKKAKAGEGQVDIEIIRGDKVETVSVPEQKSSADLRTKESE
jgi:pilus assembly protein CpaB